MSLLPKSFILLFSFFFLGYFLCLGQTRKEKFSVKMLISPKLYSEEFDDSFEVEITPEFTQQDSTSILIENGYASSILKDENNWKENVNAIIPDSIKVIFSMYPKNQEFWMTNYHVLLAHRLKALFRIAPKLNSNDIHWSIVLQTDCENELEAIGLFHGFEITGKTIAPLNNEEIVVKEEFVDSISFDSTRFSEQFNYVSQFIQENGGLSDSTVFNVLERNRHWSNSIVVIDWTGSMYHHGALSVLWHIVNLENTHIKYFTFFNDGNRKKKRKKKIGKTGGIYFVDASDVKKVASYFKKIMRKGDGGDSPENDVEALKRATRKYKSFDHIILVADNRSCVRDFLLYEKLKTPVHIILPGKDKVINHQYINLAYKTRGSIHTFDKDILDFAVEKRPKEITINGIRYFRNHYGLFQPTDPLSYHFCNQFYKIKKYTKRIREAY